MKKRIVVIGSIIIVLGLLLFLAYSKEPFLKDSVVDTKVNELTSQKEFEANILDTETNLETMRNFIADRLPESNVLLDFDLEEIEPDDVTSIELQEELFSMFSTALLTQDIDLLSAVVTGEAIRELWGKEENIEENLKKLDETVVALSRDGLYEKLSYQLNAIQKDTDKRDGTMNLSYKDGVVMKIPFEIELVDGREIPYYLFNTSIKEMLSVIQNQ